MNRMFPSDIVLINWLLNPKKLLTRTRVINVDLIRALGVSYKF